MTRTRQLAVMAVSMAVFGLLGHHPVLYPVRLFVTTLHETGHGFFCLISGGEVAGITVFRDGSGVTQTRGGIGFLVLSGGYLGSAFFGGLLILGAGNRRVGPWLHHLVACVLVAITLQFARSVFTGIVMLLLAAAMSQGVGRLRPDRRRDFFLGLGTITGMTALDDIRMLFLTAEGTVGGKPMLSDAQALAEATGIPALFWALLWGSIALAFLYRITRYSLADGPGDPANPAAVNPVAEDPSANDPSANDPATTGS